MTNVSVFSVFLGIQRQARFEVFVTTHRRYSFSLYRTARRRRGISIGSRFVSGSRRGSAHRGSPSRRRAARATRRATVSRLRRCQSAGLSSPARAARRCSISTAESRHARASRNPSPVRNNPTERHIRSRTAAMSKGLGLLRFAARWGFSLSPPRSSRNPSAGFRSLLATASRAGPCIATPARAPNTSPSSSELLARRLAPWTPVQAVSPAANRPGIDVRPHSSVSTPPMK